MSKETYPCEGCAGGGRVNFTLAVGEESMTGTACGHTCATLKPKKAPF
jgi:hypothetical protein